MIDKNEFGLTTLLTLRDCYIILMTILKKNTYVFIDDELFIIFKYQN